MSVSRSSRRRPTILAAGSVLGVSALLLSACGAAPEEDSAASGENQDYAGCIVPSRDQMRQLVIATAQALGVDPALAQAVAYQESGFNMRAVSSADAVGVMQVIPASGEWASQLAGRPLDLLDPQDNVTAGVIILRTHLRELATRDEAIGAYYQGAAAVRRHGLYPGTVTYVASVNALIPRFG